MAFGRVRRRTLAATGIRTLDTHISDARELRLTPHQQARKDGTTSWPGRPVWPATAEQARRVLVFAALGACAALALLLRLHRLGEASLWADELATVAMLQLPLSDIFGPIARLEPNPPPITP